jgi:putative Mn2+ efflux pump MntP
MIRDVFRSDSGDSSVGNLDLRSLFMMAFATSVDALAVGVTFGMDPSVNIVEAALTIGITTFAICFAGVAIGNIFGSRWQSKAQITGGVMLILVGTKILLEGLGIMNMPL